MIATGALAPPQYGEKITIDDGFFGKFETRRQFRDLLQQVDSVVDASKGKKIFFGPLMEFLYAREGLSSPSNLPVWWHPGSSYAISREPDISQAWQEHRFDVLIFNKNDRTRFPQALLSEIQSQYEFDNSNRAIDVFYRK